MAAGAEQGRDGPGAEQIRSCLERIVRDGRFVHSRGLCRFLRFTVEETLGGRGETIKESVLGPEVFDRRGDFDPRLDPIVRIQAGKVRNRLEQYYQTEGSADEVIIEYPKGSYVPVFRRRPAAPTLPVEAPRRAGLRSLGGRLRWIAAAALTVGAMLAIWDWLRPKQRYAASAIEQITADTGTAIFPAISRDGNLVVYSSDRGGGGDLDLWVRSVSGGEPVRLTRGPGADITPDFSPDGQSVAFRSNRDESGLYLVHVLGGAEIRLSDTGWRPRFSPDGKWIIYQAPGKRPGGDLWLMPGGGGQPRRVEIRNHVELGGGPVWTPDGRYIVFFGFDESRSADWWVVSPQGGEAVPTGLAKRMRIQRLGDLNADSTPGDWLENEMLFSVVRGTTANLWLVPFSSHTWRVSGALRQLTFGSAMELSPRASAAGRVVFSGNALLTRLWSIPLESGDARPLTQDSSLRPGHYRAVVRFSASEGLLAFASRRSGNSDIWLKDLASGAERALAGTSEPEEHPLFSPDGRTIAYAVVSHGQHALYVVTVEHGLSRKVCQDCGEPYSWFPDSRTVVHGTRRGSTNGLASIDISTGAKRQWELRDHISVWHATVSPDGRWAILVAADLDTGAAELEIVPLHGGAPAENARWTAVSSAQPEGPAVFTPRGDRIFYLASVDGFRCLWTHSFEPTTGRVGPPQAFRHFHNSRIAPWNSWLWLAGGQLVLTMTESTSNVWSFLVSR
jgi:Tol biopolymer transport system component